MQDVEKSQFCTRCNERVRTEEEAKKDFDLHGFAFAQICEGCRLKAEEEKAEKKKQEELEEIRGCFINFCNRIPKFLNINDEDFSPKYKPVGDLLRFLAKENKTWCFFLYGDYGTGKTHLAYWALKRAVKAGVVNFYNSYMDAYNIKNYKGSICTESSEIVAIYQNEYSKRDGDPLESIKCFYQVAVLLIDDLGAEKDSPDSRRILEDLLCYRYNNQLKTIVTSNTQMQDMKTRYSGRLASRLSSGQDIVLSGEDRRNKK